MDNIDSTYVSNLNSVSALFDRLITEKIKLYFFEQMKSSDSVVHSIERQKKTIATIHMALHHTFTNIFNDKKYNVLLEKRTFNNALKNLTLNVEQLVEMNLNVGTADNAIATILEQLFLSRSSLEKRSNNKNTIDESIVELLS
jgi:hypothetical protein